jgi:AcrR family transcriptional regulator
MATPPGTGRTRILRAARTFFLERGFTGVSMQQIAAAAGITKATLYHHFRDKVELYIAVVVSEHEQTGKNVQQLIEGATSLEEQLERIAVAFFATGEADFGRLAKDLQQHVDKDRVCALHEQMHSEAVTSPEGVISGCFARAVETGEIIPIAPEIPFALFFGMLHGLKQFSEMPESHGKIGEEEAALIPKILLHGIAASSALRDADFPRYSERHQGGVIPFGARHDVSSHSK